MTCYICDNPNYKGTCYICGDVVLSPEELSSRKRWDKFYSSQCYSYASNSLCLSRQVGVVLVKDRRIISGGYNGPPRGIPHCGICKREGGLSGTNLGPCPAAHGEANAIVNAASAGVSIEGSILYINTEVLPCFECVKLIINAGIVEIVAEGTGYYDDKSEFLYKNSQIRLRKFEAFTDLTYHLRRRPCQNTPTDHG